MRGLGLQWGTFKPSKGGYTGLIGVALDTIIEACGGWFKA